MALAREGSYRDALRRSWTARQGVEVRRQVSEGGETTRMAPPRRLRRQLFERILREVESEGLEGLRQPVVARSRARKVLSQALEERGATPLSPVERDRLETELVAELVGLGPLEPLFADPTISDVLVNGPDEVWVDRFGKLERTEVRFDDESHLRRLLQRMVSAHGRHLDEAAPMVDVRLSDGSRLHALLPPLCATGPIVSIRRSRAVPLRLAELYANGTLSPAMGDFLASAVRTGLNIVVSGGASSGKTTLLNVVSRFIPQHERVVTIEETAELKLDHPHVLALEARLPNVEGRGEVTVRSLVRNTLRMRPDRLIVGEVRGPEVFDMLQAMNSGHEGSLTTVHANTAGDALRRLENLVLLGGFELPSRAIRELLAATLHLVVQTNRFADGTRRVTSIGEVRWENEELSTAELYRFETERAGTGVGRHGATGVRSRFHDRLVRSGWRPPVEEGSTR
jgi:pilus assembly protein CpaF